MNLNLHTKVLWSLFEHSLASCPKISVHQIWTFTSAPALKFEHSLAPYPQIWTVTSALPKNYFASPPLSTLLHIQLELSSGGQLIPPA